MEKIFQILLETDEIPKRAALFERHEQVKIAAFVTLTASQGAEDTYVPGPVAHGQGEDVRAIRLEDGAAHYANQSSSRGFAWRPPLCQMV